MSELFTPRHWFISFAPIAGAEYSDQLSVETGDCSQSCDTNKLSISSPPLQNVNIGGTAAHIYNFCVYSKTAGSVSDSDYLYYAGDIVGIGDTSFFDIRHRVVLVCVTVFLLRDKVILPTKWWALFSWIILSFIILILVTTTFKSRPRPNLRRLFCFIEIVEISHFIANNVSVKSNVLSRPHKYSQDLQVRTTSRGIALQDTFGWQNW